MFPIFAVMIPLRKPVLDPNGSAATMTAGQDSSYQMTRVGGACTSGYLLHHHKEPLVTSTDKSGHVMTSLSRQQQQASGNAKRPADRRGFTPTTNSSSAAAATNSSPDKQQLLQQSSQHKLKHKLISIFWHRRWAVHWQTGISSACFWSKDLILKTGISWTFEIN